MVLSGQADKGDSHNGGSGCNQISTQQQPTATTYKPFLSLAVIHYLAMATHEVLLKDVKPLLRGFDCQVIVLQRGKVYFLLLGGH